MGKKEVVKSLLTKAGKNVQTAKDLFISGHYDWCLFIWHLVIEETLKAKLISLDKEIIYTHNLVRLMKEANLSISDELEDELKEITTYNIEARYDDYKFSFYKKATKLYTKNWANKCRKIYEFIKKSI